VIEPRKDEGRGSRRSRSRGRQHRRAAMARRGGPTGVEERRHARSGMPRNLGGPAVSTAGNPVREAGRSKPRPGTVAAHRVGSKRAVATVVTPTEGNEARRDGRQGVGVLHKTCDVGEPAPGDPAEDKGAPGHGTVGGKDGGHTTAHDCLNETTTDSETGEADAGDGTHLAVASQFTQDLEANLEDLLNRAKSGRYRAPAVRRVNIPKDKGKTRPLGIPTFADKVLQRAIVMALQPVYEQDFLDCSYGFRPNRSAHKALDALWHGLMRMGGGWVLDLDIQRFFDELDRGQLQHFLRQRVSDGVVRRLVGKWLNAGVMEGGAVHHPTSGTPQGGVISPMLANIYLHEVLDLWFEREVKPRMHGRAFMVRYADDAVMCFEQEDDARRVLSVLPKRVERFGLTLHPEKTRLMQFTRPPRGGGPRKHETFDLLGFTHYWGRSRTGSWVLKRRTSHKRFSRALRDLAQWCRKARHLPVREQHQQLTRKLRGHDAYYGITGNADALARLRHSVARIWRKWLNRRSHRTRMHWERCNGLLQRYPLPRPVVVHSVHRRPANP
jgi:RNA-directed DNA polymerase